MLIAVNTYAFLFPGGYDVVILANDDLVGQSDITRLMELLIR